MQFVINLLIITNFKQKLIEILNRSSEAKNETFFPCHTKRILIKFVSVQVPNYTKQNFWLMKIVYLIEDLI